MSEEQNVTCIGTTDNPYDEGYISKINAFHLSVEGISTLQRNKRYAVTECVLSSQLPLNYYLECIQAGTTGANEIKFDSINEGSVIIDNEVKFIIRRNISNAEVTEYLQTLSSASGDAYTAIRLVDSAGSEIHPVYFKDGVPAVTTFTLKSSVPENAVFTDTTYNNATSTISGLMSAQDKSKLDTVAQNANNYVLPVATYESLGGVSIANGHLTINEQGRLDITRDNIKNILSYIPAPPTTASQTAAGLMSSSDKARLDNIKDNANNYVHPVTSGNKHIPSGGSSGKILRWVSDGTAAWGDEVNSNYALASHTTNGIMSKDDKIKLDNITSNANNYTLPEATSTTLGGVKIGSNIGIKNGTISLVLATKNTAGLMSPQDKLKLDNIQDSIFSTDTVDKLITIKQGYNTFDTGCFASAQYNFIKWAQIQITDIHANQIITFKVCRRNDYIPTTISVMFNNTENLNPDLNSFIADGYSNGFYIEKTSNGLWTLYCKKTEQYDNISVLSFNMSKYMSTKAKVTFIDKQQVASISSNAIQANGFKLKRVLVGRNGALGTASQHWFNFATVVLDSEYQDTSISFKVNRYYVDNSQGAGILTAHIRNTAITSVEVADLGWEIAGEKILPEDFQIAYRIDNTAKKVYAELWVKVYDPHTVYHFNVINEGSRETFTNNNWHLIENVVGDNANVSVGRATSTSGYTVKESTLLSIKNPINALYYNNIMYKLAIDANGYIKAYR